MPKTITLSQPLDAGDGKITSVTLRDPTFKDFMELGETHVFARNKDGTIYTAESIDTIRGYIERLCDCDPLLLSHLGLKDARALKGAVLDFFEQSSPAQ